MKRFIPLNEVKQFATPCKARHKLDSSQDIITDNITGDAAHLSTGARVKLTTRVLSKDYTKHSGQKTSTAMAAFDHINAFSRILGERIKL
jgi:hypothetical protein